MKKLFSLILAFSLLITCFGCDKLPVGSSEVKETNVIAADATYYHVTNAYTVHDKNFYMELDVKIPKIEYSNEDSDALIDPINEEILNTITENIENAKANAMDTYEVYLATAVENIKFEKEKRINDLKSKYKNIIGTDEVKAIAAVMNTSIPVEPDFRNGFGFRRGAPFFDKTASFSDADSVIINDRPLNGFTSTEVVIDPNLHNKKIIIKSETDATIKEASKNISETVTIEGRPGKRPQKQNTESSTTEETTIKEIVTEETIKETEIETKIKDLPEILPEKIIATESSTDIDLIIGNVEKEEQIENLTLVDFYRELNSIRHITIPNKSSLTRAYIPTYIYCDFDVKCLDEDYLSLYIELSEARTTEKVKTFFYNIDLKNKKVIGIKDILGENYKENCINTINAAIDSWDETKKTALNKDYDITKFIDENTKFFINNNHMPVIVFDKYSIGSSALSYPEFVVTKK